MDRFQSNPKAFRQPPGTDDREARSKFWVAAYTRPRSEKKAASELEALGLEVYLPLQKQLKQWSDRKKWVETVVAPMVLFLNVDKNDLLTIRKHPLILKLFTAPGSKETARIPIAEIEKLKFILDQSELPVTIDPSLFVKDTKVRIIRGSLMGVCGIIESSDGESAVFVTNMGILGGAKVQIKISELGRLR